jgi:moderate conductance mechanosensitive channel
MDNIQALVWEFIRNNIMDIVWILILFFIGRIILRVVINRLVKLADDGDNKVKSMKEKRADTLGKTVLTIGDVVIYSITLLMILSIFGIDIRPILAGVGIIGLAVGFGAQSLVKNFVAGLFILIENQYNIGDRVKISAYEGVVKRITLYSTMLEGEEGNIYLPNGSITNVTNKSRKKKKK